MGLEEAKCTKIIVVTQANLAVVVIGTNKKNIGNGVAIQETLVVAMKD